MFEIVVLQYKLQADVHFVVVSVHPAVPMWSILSENLQQIAAINFMRCTLEPEEILIFARVIETGQRIIFS